MCQVGFGTALENSEAEEEARAFWLGNEICKLKYCGYRRSVMVTVAGRIMAPRDVHILIPRICTVLPYIVERSLQRRLRIMRWA